MYGIHVGYIMEYEHRKQNTGAAIIGFMNSEALLLS